LLKDKFEISGEAGAAAGPVGRHASAATDWTAGPGILTYSRSRGLFAGVTLEGAVVHQDDDSTGAVYGSHGQAFYHKILAGEVPTTAIAEPFLASVRSVDTKSARAERKEGEKPDRGGQTQGMPQSDQPAPKK